MTKCCDASVQVKALQEKVAKLEGDIQCMVKKAADKHLDGYRELGQKCADLETAKEQAEADRKADAVAFFRWWYNQPGTNTEQGYDKWFALKEVK